MILSNIYGGDFSINSQCLKAGKFIDVSKCPKYAFIV